MGREAQEVGGEAKSPVVSSLRPFQFVRRKASLFAILGVIIALVVIGLWLRPQPTPDRLRVVFKTNANYLIYFVARDKGFLREAGLTIEETEMESTNLMIQALSTGAADFNPSASVPALYSAEQAAPGTFAFLYITLMQRGRTNDAIIVRKDAPYQSLRDLAGRRIGAQPGATSVILLRLIFEAVGVNSDSLHIQELEPRALLQSLAAKQIDAVFAIEPLITMGEEMGISRVLAPEVMENHIMNPIPIAGGVVTKEFLREHPDVARRLRVAMERAIDFTRENEQESRVIMARAIGMSDSTASKLGVNTYWKQTEVEPAIVQSLADLFLRHGALDRRLDTGVMLTGGTN